MVLYGWLKDGVGDGSCTASKPIVGQKEDCDSLQVAMVGLGVDARLLHDSAGAGCECSTCPDGDHHPEAPGELGSNGAVG